MTNANAFVSSQEVAPTQFCSVETNIVESMKSTGAKLLETGDFSDLTVVCGNRAYKLHKAIMCPKSTWIAGLVADGDDCIEIDCESDEYATVFNAVIKYLYTGAIPEGVPDDLDGFRAKKLTRWLHFFMVNAQLQTTTRINAGLPILQGILRCWGKDAALGKLQDEAAKTREIDYFIAAAYAKDRANEPSHREGAAGTIMSATGQLKVLVWELVLFTKFAILRSPVVKQYLKEIPAFRQDIERHTTALETYCQRELIWGKCSGHCTVCNRDEDLLITWRVPGGFAGVSFTCYDDMHKEIVWET
ncbi:hypothetical protein F4780DRAFT_736307 [Xylariomycetidae sp. FL0641]|nr:hypothetical protein F4780DRAFT_736307 [Xylariomycetidae sp. FL0641]